MIPWNVVLQKMKSFDSEGNPTVFDIEVKAADKKRDTGKMILRYSGFTVNGLKKKASFIQHQEKVEKLQGKNPNHRSNSTLNIKSVRTGEIKSIHVRLITRFNGEKVIY